MEISEFISRFRKRIMVDGGDESTARVYGDCIAVFLRHYENKHTSPERIPLADIEDYILHMRESKKSNSYINQFIASAKRFYCSIGQPKKCNSIKYFRKEIPMPNILTYDECMKMCNAKIYIKHQAIINLLYYGALRRSELINLKISDISKDRRISINKSKFGKSRVIIVPEETLILLRKYFIQCNPKEYLFNGDCGRIQYSAGSIENIIKNTARLMGITKRVHPHLLRSSRITHLIDNGASLAYVSEFAGHADIKTTRNHYCKLTLNAMMIIFDEADKKIIETHRQ